MQWEHIPEPLDIRPCEKPKELKARQLAQHPLRLKKLPDWLTYASFQVPQNFNSSIQNVGLSRNLQKYDQSEIFQSLQEKYNKNERFKKVYERQQIPWTFHTNFAFQFISTDYVELSSQPKCQTQSLKDKTDKTDRIKFDSCFQCGNLDKVYQKRKIKQFKDQQIKQNEQEYHLIMQNDINTQGYTQWFFFQIINPSQQSKKITLKIVNFLKAFSLYKIGMKPWIITKNQRIWKPSKADLTYIKTNVKNDFGQYFYMIQFDLEIEPGQSYISMMPVYSYTRLCQKAKNWLKIDGMQEVQKKSYTLLNNIVPILEYIPKNQSEQMAQEEKKWLDTFVFSARTHPGQVWSSFIMEELIQNVIIYHRNLTQKNSNVRYIFVPMLNPDGVIYGNFRCDFSGVDLNRVWLNPNKYTEPSIFNLKKYFAKEFEKKKAKYFVDLHSHSKNLNVFAYTCGQTVIQGRLVPDLIRLTNENKIFDFFPSNQEINNSFLNNSQTTFISSKQILSSCKKSTARAFMSQLVQKSNAMTVQISFYGYQPNKFREKSKIKIFQPAQFKQFSWLLIKNLNACINNAQSVMIAKKMLKSLYNSNQRSSINRQNFLTQKARQFPNQLTQVLSDVNEDSQSQPQKYYTAQTKRKKNTKQKDGKKYGKNLMSQRKKGYLKKTQSIVNKFQGMQRNKQKSAFDKLLGKQSKKNLDIDFVVQNRSRNISFDIAYKKPAQPKISPQKYTQNLKKSIQVRQRNISNRKLRQTSTIQNKKQDNKSPNSPNSDQNTKKFINNSFIEAVDLSTQISNKVIPTFGKFLPTSKRNQYRRYKTITRQMVASKEKKTQNLKNIKTEVKDENNFSAEKQKPKINSHHQQVFVNVNSMTPSISQKAKNSCRNLKSLKNSKRQNTVKDQEIMIKKGYLDQRSRILEMMKKQTRICVQYVRKQAKDQGIEQIVSKRQRAKTQCQSNQDIIRFEDKNIFMRNKVLPQKLKNISRKIEQLKMRQISSVHYGVSRITKK